MKMAAYQFDVTGNIEDNLKIIRRSVVESSEQKVELIVFPECALSGYPPRDMSSSSDVDECAIRDAISDIQAMSEKCGISIIIGTIAFENGKYYNRAYYFSPDKPMQWYGKRALYGWDEENFCAGEESGIFNIAGLHVGVRICYEIRFPEYFRQLYLENTDLNIVLFYDVADKADDNRYQLIRSHIITRAVENVTPCLTVNATFPNQTAPTCFVDASGKVCAELEQGKEGMLIYGFEKKKLDFG
ncbi:MAG: carbon-nitrogen hydrolase family protein, partial [Butyrivibrio sp.]|uniref:carbon-nitrogen hydrolase family protein n=1 Tax=Butyrivibrio sp. TaxID=28121 RepID=UPI0025E5750A